MGFHGWGFIAHSEAPTPMAQLVPSRCFTCGKVLGDKWTRYVEAVNQAATSPTQALDHVGLHRYCCRTMFLTHVELMDQFLTHETAASTHARPATERVVSQKEVKRA